MKRLHFAAFFAAFAIACGAPASDDAASSATEQVTSAPVGHQFVPYVDPAEIDAAFAKFQARNPGKWTMRWPELPKPAPELTTALNREFLNADVPEGPSSLNDAERLAIVREFIRKNADLLGIDDPGAAHIHQTASDIDTYYVTDDAPVLIDLPQGYSFFVHIGANAEIASFIGNWKRYPKLTIDPSTEFDLAPLRRAIDGVELTVVGHPFRTLTKNDIGPGASTSISLTLRETPGVGGVTLRKVLDVSLSDETFACHSKIVSWMIEIDLETNHVTGGTDTSCVE